MKIKKTMQLGVKLYEIHRDGQHVCTFTVCNGSGWATKNGVWLWVGTNMPMPKIDRNEAAELFRKIRKEAA